MGANGVLELNNFGKGVAQYGGKRAIRQPLERSVRVTAEMLYADMTDRDFRIFEALQIIGLMSRDQIQRLEWPGSKPQLASNRLNKFYKNWIVELTQKARLREIGMAPCKSFSLGKVGYALLDLHMRETARRHGRNYNKAYGPSSMITHDIMIAEVFLQAALDIRRLNIQSRWVGEWDCVLLEGEKPWVRPDGIMAFQPGGDESPWRHYFLEMDRDSVKQLRKRWLDKIDKYEAAKMRTQWRGTHGMQQFPPVAAVVPDGFGEKVAKVLGDNKKSVNWLVKEWSDILKTGAISEWYDLATNSYTNLI